MDRRSFRSILMKSSAVSLTRTLRSVEVLKSLSVGQLQRLQDLLTEVTFKNEEYVIRQGEASENLYIIAEGRVRITKEEEGAAEARHDGARPGAYFGERALLTNEVRAANVIATGDRRSSCSTSRRTPSRRCSARCRRSSTRTGSTASPSRRRSNCSRSRRGSPTSASPTSRSRASRARRSPSSTSSPSSRARVHHQVHLKSKVVQMGLRRA